MDDNHSIEMSSEAFAALNVPFSISSIVLNIIFVFFLKFPQQGAERLKQPLKALLGSLVGCNITANAFILVTVIMVLKNILNSFNYNWCVTSIAIYIMMISMNSSHWLNVFYCFQIVPVQRAYLIWFKRNIRVFIYCSLIIDTAVCFLGMSVNIAFVFTIDKNITDSTLYTADTAAFWMTLSLFFISLCVMLTSSCVTVYFLWRHMKNMENSSDSISSPRRQRLIRVTIRSISVQALLHITCSTLVIIDEIIIIVSPYYFDMEGNVLCTISSLYFLGTTINLGLSQSVFRQRAVYIWRKHFRPRSPLSAITTAQTSFSNILSS